MAMTDVADYQNAQPISIHELCASTSTTSNADDKATPQQVPATVDAPTLSSRRIDALLGK